MHLQVDNDAMQEALRIISRLAPPAENGSISIRFTGKKVYINSSNDSAKCEINLPADVEGKAQTFALSLNALRDATKGRAKLDITYDKTLCKIKSGNYKCELPTVDAMQIEETEDVKLTKIDIDETQAKWMRAALNIVSLKPTPLIATYMPISIKLSKKGAFVACYDSNHMAFVSNKEIQGKMELKVPIDIFSAVLEVFDKAKFVIELSASNLYVSNRLVSVSLSLPQEDENDLKMEEVIETAKSTKSADGREFTIPKIDIVKFLDNARAVATKERSEVRIAIQDQKMKLEVVTANGTIKALLKVDTKKKISALIDFEFLDEAIRKSGDTVDVKLVESEFMAFKLAKGNIVVSLNQE